MIITYAEISRIEKFELALIQTLSDTLESIISAEKRVYIDNVDALDPGLVDNPYSKCYHFAYIGASYYQRGELTYVARPDRDYIEVTLILVYDDGDYASSIIRKIPYTVFTFTTETEFYDMVYANWMDAQVERQVEERDMQAARERDRLRELADQSAEDYAKYLILKEKFEHA